MTISRKTKGVMAALGAVVLAALGCYAFQLANGLAVTGMSNANSWGLYIIMFMFFVGLSAGGLIVASSASVFHIESFKNVALPAVICSTVCICCAGMFVLIDLGGIARVWRILAGPNPTSPLFWDICVITCYLVINILDMVWIVRGDERKVEILSRIALPVAILVHSVTAWIFGLQIAKEGWSTAIMAPIFVASACDSGLALLLLALAGLGKAKVFEAGEKLMASLGRLLAVFIAVDAFFIGCELLTTAYSGTEAGSTVLAHMFTGATAPFFWFEVVCGLLVPFLILVVRRGSLTLPRIVGASVLVVCGVLCKRVWLLLTSFITPNIAGAPGISLGTAAAQADVSNMWALAGSYAPTPLEIVIVLGVISVGLLAFILLVEALVKPRSGVR